MAYLPDPTKLQVQDPRKVVTVIVPAGAAGGPSVAVDLQGYRVGAIVMPGTWVAASLTFLGSPDDNSDYQSVYDGDGGEVAMTVVQAQTHVPNAVQTLALTAFRFLQLRSGTKTVPVDQTVQRTLTLVLVPV